MSDCGGTELKERLSYLTGHMFAREAKTAP